MEKDTLTNVEEDGLSMLDIVYDAVIHNTHYTKEMLDNLPRDVLEEIYHNL